MRSETRRQRVENKLNSAVQLPFAVANIAFQADVNTCNLLRTAAAFGVKEYFVIGSQNWNYEGTGKVEHFINIQHFPNPHKFLLHIRNNTNYRLFSVEQTNESFNVVDYVYEDGIMPLFVMGNETTGVPVEILAHSTHLEIPMPGIVPCLNVAMAGGIVIYDYYLKMRNKL